MAGGGWFAIGPSLSQLWNHGISQTGPALGGTGQRVAEQLAYFYGLGTLIIAVAGFALGRLAVRSVRDAELEAETAAAAPADPAADQARRTRESGRFGRESEPVAAGAQTDTLTAADRVQTAAQTERRGIFRRRSV
jgi:hypothetical protein